MFTCYDRYQYWWEGVELLVIEQWRRRSGWILLLHLFISQSMLALFFLWTTVNNSTTTNCSRVYCGKPNTYHHMVRCLPVTQIVFSFGLCPYSRDTVHTGRGEKCHNNLDKPVYVPSIRAAVGLLWWFAESFLAAALRRATSHSGAIDFMGFIFRCGILHKLIVFTFPPSPEEQEW